MSNFALVHTDAEPRVKPFDLVIELMNCPRFRALFDSSFNTFSDIEAVLTIMKAYQYLERLYMHRYGHKPDPEYMRDGIRKIIANKNARAFLVGSIKKFISEDGQFDKIVEQENILTLECKPAPTTYILQFDGASRGNPGPAGAGARLTRALDGVEVWWAYEFLGDSCTNNEAEYRALVFGLKAAIQLQNMGILNGLTVQGDSKLVIMQTKDAWAVKAANLKPLHQEAKDLLASIEGVCDCEFILRGLNGRADQLANLAIDERASKSFGPCS